MIDRAQIRRCPVPAETSPSVTASVGLQAALEWARLGWLIYPVHNPTPWGCSCTTPGCGSAGKHPRTKHGYKDATRDPTQVAAWWGTWPDANVGIATGAQSGLVVLDVDPRNNGTASLAALEQKFGPLPETPTVETGGGGRHHYFRYPQGRDVRSRVLAAAGSGLDVKGDGGGVVAPPSKHKSGGGYHWAAGLAPDEVGLADLPAWLLEIVTGNPTVNVGAAVNKISERIPEGQRHETLVSLAGTMRRRGMSPTAISAALIAENAARCDPPLPAVEVRGIGTSMGRYPPGAGAGDTSGTRNPDEIDALVAYVEAHPDEIAAVSRRSPIEAPDPASSLDVAAQAIPTTWHRTDSGNAELFAKMFGDRVRFDHSRRRWLVWRGHHWQPDDNDELQRLAKQAARERLRQAADIENEAVCKEETKHAFKSENRDRRKATLELAQAEHPIADAGKDWDGSPWLLGVPNGVVDLRTGTLRPGRRDDRITMQARVPFEPDASCPRWTTFLEEICGGDKTLLEFVQRAAGYSLSGDCSEEVLLVCYGTGANGKSTLLETLRYVAGDYGYNMPFSTLELHGRSSIPNDVAALVQRRLVTASETNESTRLNEARVKALTGRDAITARFLHGEFFTFQPKAKLWLAVNHKPNVSDDSEGFWRRVRLVPFLNRFTGTGADKRLREKLCDEAAGILAWMVRGCLGWQQAGELGMPTAIQEATDGYRAEMDPLADFLAERCVVHPEASATSAALWEAFQNHANGDRVFVASRRAFVERLKLHGFVSTTIGHGKTRGWRGLRLKSDAEQGSWNFADGADACGRNNPETPPFEDFG